jgi:hypothetical protein
MDAAAAQRSLEVAAWSRSASAAAAAKASRRSSKDAASGPIKPIMLARVGRRTVTIGFSG